MSTGARVRYYRQKMGWTLEQLAFRCGVEVGTISAIEQRDSSRSAQFLRIAPAFGLSVEQLADATVDHPVRDAHPAGWEAAQTGAAMAVKEPVAPYADAWMQAAVAALQQIQPEYREETLNFLKWQVGRKARPECGNHLPLAA